jgi:hypothetical protein
MTVAQAYWLTDSYDICTAVYIKIRVLCHYFSLPANTKYFTYMILWYPHAKILLEQNITLSCDVSM